MSGTATVNVEPTSPAPSVDRLSVTFAMDEEEKLDEKSGENTEQIDEKTEEKLVSNEPNRDSNEELRDESKTREELEDVLGPEVCCKGFFIRIWFRHSISEDFGKEK